MKINMTDKYAESHNPTKQVRILCIDAPGLFPVVVLNDSIGYISKYTASGGKCRNNIGHLVPLEEPLLEGWIAYGLNSARIYHTREQAVTCSSPRCKIIKVREVK